MRPYQKLYTLWFSTISHFGKGKIIDTVNRSVVVSDSGSGWKGQIGDF